MINHGGAVVNDLIEYDLIIRMFEFVHWYSDDRTMELHIREKSQGKNVFKVTRMNLATQHTFQFSFQGLQCGLFCCFYRLLLILTRLRRLLPSAISLFIRWFSASTPDCFLFYPGQAPSHAFSIATSVLVSTSNIRSSIYFVVAVHWIRLSVYFLR